MRKPYFLLIASLLILIMALVLASQARTVTPAFGLSQDMAYLLIVAVSAWLMICGMAVGYLAVLTGERSSVTIHGRKDR
jgi:hypothetical protein